MAKNLSPDIKKSLSVFSLVMMTVIAIDSIKNLPANAQYGSSLLVYYFIAVVAFFIPSALVAAELATAWPETGGIYIWVREAFGKRTAFLTAWMQWLYQIIWYPTILSFIAVTISDLIMPGLAENKMYVLSTTLTIFWLATFLNCKGLNISSKVSTFCTLIGVVVPTLFITLLGFFWIYSGNPVQIDFSPQSISMHLLSNDNLRLFITLMFSLMGMEMIAIHAGDVSNPERNYPRALIMASMIIFVTMIPASLAISAVIPVDQISLTKGVMDGFTVFLSAFHLHWLKPLMAISIAVGSFGIFLVWLLSAARCLFVAASDNCLPAFLQRTNEKNMPVVLFMVQGVIFTLLCSAFILMPSVNSAFWILTASSSQIALIYYLFLFTSALRLRYKKPDVARPFKVGKHPLIMWVICSLAIITCTVSIGFGFIPPAEISGSKIVSYEIFLAALILGGWVTALMIYEACQAKFNKTLVLSDDGVQS